MHRQIDVHIDTESFRDEWKPESGFDTQSPQHLHEGILKPQTLKAFLRSLGQGSLFLFLRYVCMYACIYIYICVYKCIYIYE